MTHPTLHAGSKVVNAANAVVRTWVLLENPRPHCPVNGTWKARAMFTWGEDPPKEVELFITRFTTPVAE